jgi:hypothetical protein
MLAVLPATVLLLTGCSVNAPMNIPMDIHDNVINNPSVTVPSDALQGTPGSDAPNPLPDLDPNRDQNTPDSWDESDVDTPDPIELPESWNGEQVPFDINGKPGTAWCMLNPTYPGC